MSSYLQTYCSLEFLERFYDEIDELWRDASEDDYKARILTNIKSLLHRRSDIYMDCDLNQDHVYLRKIKRQRASFSGPKLLDFSQSFQKLVDKEYIENHVTPSSFHLHDGPEVYADNSILCARPQDWYKTLQKVSKAGEEYKISPVKKLHTFPGWKQLVFKHEIHQYPMNSLIIADNFIWGTRSESKEARSKNIFDILKNLLPINLNQTFHLTIILSREKFEGRGTLILETIKKVIKELNLKYSVEVGVYLLKYHAREILSNYWRITLNHAFDFYNKDGSINQKSSLEFVPLNWKDGNNHHAVRLELKSATKNVEHGRYWLGTTIPNRLLI